MAKTSTFWILPVLILAIGSMSVTAVGDSPAEPEPVDTAHPESPSAEPDAILYYFHRTLRCRSCLAIEAILVDLLETDFADAVATGLLQWRPTNVEEPEHEHFLAEYPLEYNSAILVSFDAERRATWVNLEKTWDYWDDAEKFRDYVRPYLTRALASFSGTGQ